MFNYLKSHAVTQALILSICFVSIRAFGHGGAPPPPPPPPPKPTLNNVAATINEDTDKNLNPGVNGQGYSITSRKINSAPANGTASWSGNNLDFRPNANWCGRTSFTYSVATSAGWSAVRTATMTVNCVVDQPWVGNKNGTVQEDTSITLAPSISLDGGTVSARYINTQPSNGSVSWSDNKLVYTPKANWCGTDTFKYSLKTQGGTSNIGTSTISVSCVVDLPIVGNVSGSLDEDTAKTFTPSIFTDGAPVTKYIIKSAALRGTAVWQGSSILYTPNANFCGTDTFTYQVQTSAGTSNTGTASVTVNCILDKPTIDDVAAEFNEDTVKTFSPTIWTDGAPITARSIDQYPAHGSLVWLGDSIKYTPNTNYCGTDTFKYSVNNAAGKSNVGTGLVTVKCVVDKPTIQNVNGSVVEEHSVTLKPTYSIDGGFISAYNIDVNPNHGSAKWEAGQLVYTPNTNYCGTDTFSYSITTQGGKSNVARSDITISCVDDLPTLGNVNINTHEDTTKSARPALGTDGLSVNGKTINVLPANGTAKWVGNELEYTPNNNFCGNDSFKYSLKTSAGWSPVRTANVNVSCVTDKPTITTENGTIIEDNKLTLSPSTWTDGAPINTYNIDLPASNGNVHWNSGKLIYTPNVNYCGADTFKYSITTSAGKSNVARSNVSVTCVDDLPTLGNVSINLNEDTTKKVSPAIWTDRLTITAKIIDQNPAHGVASWDGNQLMYTANHNYCGSDSFNYSIRTSAGSSTIRKATVNVSCVIDKPVVSNKTLTTLEDTPVTFTPVINADGVPITGRQFAATPSNGQAQINGSQIEYTPNHNWCGTDTFTFRASNSAGWSNAATFTVNVTCVDDVPTISDTTFAVTEDTPKTVAPTIWTDGLAITKYTINSQASHGTAVWASNKLTYTPAPNYCGTDSFKYSVTTSAGTTQVRTASVNVACVVDTANLGNVSGSLDEDSSITKTPSVVLDGGTISKRDITQNAKNGVATWSSNKVQYVPNVNFCGVDTFKYRVTTETGYSNVATATFTVNCIQDIPTITGVGTINLNVLDTHTEVYVANDVDGDALTANLTLAGKTTLPSWIKYTFDGSKAFITFTPGENHPGDYRLEFSVNDGNGGLKYHDIRVLVRDNRPVSLTSILVKTFSIPMEFTDKEDNSLNGIHFENVRDSSGNLLTGTISVTVTVDPAVNVPVVILGKNIQPGIPTQANYTFVQPGVIDIKAIPVMAGKDGLIKFTIQFSVN